MADVEISYNDSIIASLSDSGTEILDTKGKFVGDNITVQYNRPTPTLVSKSVTANGTYNASSDNADGYSSVTVDVSSGGGSTVTITLSQFGGSFNLYLPVVATTDIDPDSPWITYIRNLPANSLIVGLTPTNLYPSCSTGITYVSTSVGSRPVTYMFAFSVGDSDGTINV